MIHLPPRFQQQARITIALFAWLFACAIAVAQKPLDRAHEAYRSGDFRTAAAELNEAAANESRMSRADRLRYWALCADVALDSGLLEKASKLAATHRALLRQEKSTAIEEQIALIRKARIERAFANASGRDRDAAAPHLRKVQGLLAEALAIEHGLRRNDPFWEAETRFDLAQTLLSLQLFDDAQPQLASASASASAGCDRWIGAAARRPKDSPEEIADYLRGVSVIRQAFVPHDQEASRQQAELALVQIKRQLQSPGMEGDARVVLLVAAANCHSQLGDPVGEKQMLTSAVQAAIGTERVDVIFQQAECEFRLAELSDASADPTQRQEGTGHYHNAAGLYAQVLDHQETPPLWQRSECLLQMQTIHSRLEDWPSAIAAAERLVALRQQSLLYNRDPNYYRAMTALGSLHAKAARSALTQSAEETRDYSAAREHTQRALTALQESVDFWRQHQPTSPFDLATALNYYGESLRYNGQFREAERSLAEARQYCDDAFDGAAITLGEFHSNRGALLAALGMFEPARLSYEDARKVAERQEATLPESGVAMARYETAKPVSDTLHAQDNARSRGQLQAIVYLNLAQLHKSQGQFDEARKWCSDAQEAAGKWLSDQDVPFRLTDAALQIAEADIHQRRINPNPRHKDAREQAAQERSQVENLFSGAIATTSEVIATGDPLNANFARHLQAMAFYRRHLLSPSEGADLNAAKQLWKEIADSTDTNDARLDSLRIRAHSALTGIALREAATLRAAANAAAQKLHEVEQGSPEANALHDNCEQQLAEAVDRLQEADARSLEAQRMAKKLEAYPALCFQALLARAQVLKAQAQIERAVDREQAAIVKNDEAIILLQDALGLIELPRAMTTGAETQRSAYFEQFSPGFDLLIDLLVQQGRLQEALAYSERRRSRTFLDQLQIAGIDLHEKADSEAVETARRARDEYYTELAKLGAKKESNGAPALQAKEIEELKIRVVEAENKVRSSSEVYRALIGKSLETATEAWKPQIDRGDIALVYYIGSERSYVFLCGENLGVEAYKLELTADQSQPLGLPEPRSNGKRPLRADDIARLVEQVTQLTMQPGERSRGADLEIVSSKKLDPLEPNDLHRVTDLLIPPAVRARIEEQKPTHVLIVPDGPLHQLAFESLPTDSRDTYLLDEFPPICYAPSLEIYQQLQAKPNDVSPQLTLLSVADPSYPEPTGESRDAAIADEFLRLLGRPLLSRLPDTKTESNNVLQCFQGTLQLTEDNATEAKLKSALHNSVRYLHVAAHGLVDQRYNNLFGALAFTPPKTPTADDDGFLTLYEAMNLRLNGCELAVLSACETNCGPENKLEAGSTMARAFFCAGARRVVCSHWQVSDEATAKLIAQFMQNVSDDEAKGQVDYATALWKAKMQLKQESRSPYEWAPFVLIGPTSGTRATDSTSPLADTRD